MAAPVNLCDPDIFYPFASYAKVFIFGAQIKRSPQIRKIVS
jgi:hypothetical protein